MPNGNDEKTGVGYNRLVSDDDDSVGDAKRAGQNDDAPSSDTVKVATAAARNPATASRMVTCLSLIHI